MRVFNFLDTLLPSLITDWIFEEWPRGALPVSLHLKFLSMPFWLDPMGLASRAGSLALPTSFGGNGSHLKQWLVMLPSAPPPDGFPNWGFLGFSSVVRQMPGNLLHCTQCPPHSIFSLIIFPSATESRDTRNWPGANGLPGWEPVTST